jgi:hypothetical protein
MKKIFYVMGVIGFVLISSLVFVGCENPASSGSGSGPGPSVDGPADGTPWVFENQSSYPITVSPTAGYTDQGWQSFTLSSGQSRTIRVDKKYNKVWVTYNYASLVGLEWASNENKGIFKNK